MNDPGRPLALVRLMETVNLTATIYRESLIEVQEGKPDAGHVADIERKALVQRLRKVADAIESAEAHHRCDDSCSRNPKTWPKWPGSAVST